MTYRGKVKDGVVVLEAGVVLPEGASVRVEAAEPAPPSAPRHFHPSGTWDGPPGELDRLLKDVQDMRNAEPSGDDDASTAA